MKMKTRILLIVMLGLVGLSGRGQHSNYNWYFGNYAAVNFSTGTPVAITGSAMMAYEGCASISDASGNLLFYTNGFDVWNRNNQIMPNGANLSGLVSMAQTAVIIPKPDSANIYYIFTNGNILCYSEVDMTLDGGLGDITVKNFLLQGNIDERLTAVRNCNGRDYWIICHNDTMSYKSYLVSNLGVSAPVISTVGQSGGWGTYLKASPNGRKIAAAMNSIEIFDFDNSTGILSNPIHININYDLYGVSFSPDNTKLYAAYGWLYQFDISSNNQATIQASVYQVNSIIGAMALQIGPDNKIYCSYPNSFNLAAINSPNVLGSGCDFADSAVYIGPSGVCSNGLPNFVDALDTNCLVETTGLLNNIKSYNLSITPNPFTTQTMLTLQGTYHNPSLFIYNLLGQEVKSIHVGTNKQITIPRNNLPSGMYFYKLIEDNKEVLGVGKLLVE